MKKAISLFLALVLVLSMSVTALAVEVDNSSQDVGATYVPGTVQIVGPDGQTTTATVYSVNLTWTSIANVSYDGGKDAYYWDASALEYKKHTTASEAAGWTADETSCTITITNSSNAAVTATAAFTPAAEIGATASCSFTNNGCVVASAAPTQAQLEAGTTAGSAKTGTITANVSVSGDLKSGVTSVGTISITIS